MGQWLLYGATGYTGRLIVEACLRRGLRPMLGGRNPQALAALSEQTQLPFCSARLDDHAGLARVLSNVEVVLLAAGPFAGTAAPMIRACLAAGVHYLDITGEALVIEAAAQQHAAARARGIMLLPAVGFDVVTSDCLASHVARRLTRPVQLAIGIAGLRLLSRGSATTFVERLSQSVLVRRDGRICEIGYAQPERCFDFGTGPKRTIAMTWGDVASAYYSTGIPNIATFFEAIPTLRMHMSWMRAWGWSVPFMPVQPWLNLMVGALPAGPDLAARDGARSTLVAVARDASGEQVSARLKTPNPYSLTAETAAVIAARVAAGDAEPGFQTPSRMFGSDFVLSFAGVAREDL